jgi:hypothetical protein
MRRRLLRLAVMAVVLPIAARGADVLASRLEATGGPSLASRSLRTGAHLADRGRRRR